jgi:ABC-type glycerol-3-phosphate transport system substrate-binding protein
MIGLNANIDPKKVEAAWKLVRFLTSPEPLFTRHYTNYVQPQRPLLGYKHLPEEIRSGFDAQIKTARSWGPYGTGPVAIPFMWNAVGRAAGSVFVGEKTSQAAAQELFDLIKKEFDKNTKG